LLLIALLLGIVEGLTEFLPVSSTGHLILFGNLVGYTGEKAATFEIFIQLGAILAVVWLFLPRFTSLLSLNNAKGFHGRNGIRLLALTTLPALVVGFLLHSYIKEYLFTPTTVAIGLALGGIAIIYVEKRPIKPTTITLDQISSKQALRVGLAQLLALYPGVSRSAATILGGMSFGLNRETAVQYSFLAAVPVMLAATSYDLLKSLPDLTSDDITFFAVGFISAFITAVLAIKVFIKLVKTNDFIPFAWYRLGLATTILLIVAFTDFL
jgi:undecaprenyl-diphosphatase